jgi:glutathione S-transferase
MSLALYAHPFSSYCQKVEIALYEAGTPFEFRMLDPEHKAHLDEQAALWPLRKMPVLVDGRRAVFEASIIIEYLDLHYPGRNPMVPSDAAAALEVRMLDRVFDNYVMTPMQKIVADVMRAPENRDAQGVAEAHQLLDTTYRWLDERMRGRQWAASAEFSLADCAAAPSLFYADWVHRIPEEFENLCAYRQRLLARPSVVRAVDEARPYRNFFPPGAPDRD